MVKGSPNLYRNEQSYLVHTITYLWEFPARRVRLCAAKENRSERKESEATQESEEAFKYKKKTKKQIFAKAMY